MKNQLRVEIPVRDLHTIGDDYANRAEQDPYQGSGKSLQVFINTFLEITQDIQ